MAIRLAIPENGDAQWHARLAFWQGSGFPRFAPIPQRTWPKTSAAADFNCQDLLHAGVLTWGKRKEKLTVSFCFTSRWKRGGCKCEKAGKRHEFARISANLAPKTNRKNEVTKPCE